MQIKNQNIKKHFQFKSRLFNKKNFNNTCMSSRAQVILEKVNLLLSCNKYFKKIKKKKKFLYKLKKFWRKFEIVTKNALIAITNRDWLFS